MPRVSWTLPAILCTFADFNPYPFPVINYKSEYESFSEFCESFYQIVKPEDDLGDSLHY